MRAQLCRDHRGGGEYHGLPATKRKEQTLSNQGTCLSLCPNQPCSPSHTHKPCTWPHFFCNPLPMPRMGRALLGHWASPLCEPLLGSCQPQGGRAVGRGSEGKRSPFLCPSLYTSLGLQRAQLLAEDPPATHEPSFLSPDPPWAKASRNPIVSSGRNWGMGPQMTEKQKATCFFSIQAM